MPARPVDDGGTSVASPVQDFDLDELLRDPYPF
ncbi:hypothetical protein C731_0725, partial [Mycolicibacterium hassiacum DSM 44199]